MERKTEMLYNALFSRDMLREVMRSTDEILQEVIDLAGSDDSVLELLYAAVEFERPDMFRQLIERGGDMYLRGREGALSHCLTLAETSGDRELIEYIVSSGS